MNPHFAEKKPPRRRFQFSLRTLLAAVVLFCVALALWHLFWNYFGRYVEADPATVGQPFTVRGSFTEFLGFESEVFVVQVSQPMADGRPLIHQSGAGRAQRTGLGKYCFEIKLPRVTRAGEYDIELRPSTKAVRRRGHHAPEDSVIGKLIVRPAPEDYDLPRGK